MHVMVKDVLDTTHIYNCMVNYVTILNSSYLFTNYYFPLSLDNSTGDKGCNVYL